MSKTSIGEGDAMKDTTKEINQKRACAAEDFCRAFREVATKRVVDATEADWSKVFDYLQRWLRLAGKSGYESPRRRVRGQSDAL